MLLGCCLYLTAREGTCGATTKASTPKQPLCILPPVLGLVYHLNQHNWDVSFASGLPGPVELFLLLLQGGRCWLWLCSMAFPTCPELPLVFLADPSLLYSTWVMIWGHQCALGAAPQSHTEPVVPVSPAAGVGRMERGGM